ncbi:thiolase family protein [Staphylococcus sp. SS35]|nr:thiolase family protein [Staphylococcus singaporensis]UMT78690.1 thiolase family protein [Staphylococcus roterodami]
MRQAVIVAAKRTAFGKYGGTLKHLEPEQLLKPLFQYYKKQYPEVITKIDDVILGNVVGNGGNIARKALLEAGLQESIPGVTIDRQCGSGLESIQYACRMIQAGAGKIYIAGGVESTSRAPWKIKRPQSVYETSLPEFYERASFAPELSDPSMIEGAENVAKAYGVTRELQDDFAFRSHQLTEENVQNKNISQEILPLTVKGKIVDTDESIKSHILRENYHRFKPIIKDGTVTAANSCMKNDGAVLLLIMEKDIANALGFKHGLLFKDSVTIGVDSTLPGIGPVPAISQLLKRNQLNIEDIDAIEINEAFSAQVVACQQALNIKNSQLNIWGGALATGHPYGASGAQLVTRLFYMYEKDTLIASMGIGGGLGNAALFVRF